VRVDLDEVRRGLGLPTLGDRGDWERVRALLRDAVGESTFDIWLDQVELIAIDGSGVLVLAVNEQAASWVRERFGRLLSRCVERNGREFRFASEPERRALERQDQCQPAEVRALRTDQKEAI
jgi:chromosomal replication initiation ATPase DnaA